MADAPKPPGGYPVKLPQGYTVPVGIQSLTSAAATTGTDTACTNGTVYAAGLWVPRKVRVTGIRYVIGSVGGTDKVIASVHDSNGAVVANSATAGATVGTAANTQDVVLTAVTDLDPGLYFFGLTFNGTTAKFRTVPAFCHTSLVAISATQTFGTVAAFTPVFTFTADKAPILGLY